MDLAKERCPPKAQCWVILPPTNYLLTLLLKAIQWPLIPLYSRIKPECLAKAHRASMIQCPPTFSGLISYLPSCFLYVSPKATYHVAQVCHVHLPGPWLQPECSSPCQHLCPPKTHIFIGQGLFLELYVKFILIAVHLFLTLDYKLLVEETFLFVSIFPAIYTYLFNKCMLNGVPAM